MTDEAKNYYLGDFLARVDEIHLAERVSWLLISVLLGIPFVAVAIA